MFGINEPSWNRSTQDSLSIRQMQVCDLLKEYLGNKEISDRLSISTRTVKFHVSNLLRIFEVTDRHALVRLLKERETKNEGSVPHNYIVLHRPSASEGAVVESHRDRPFRNSQLDPRRRASRRNLSSGIRNDEHGRNGE